MKVFLDIELWPIFNPNGDPAKLGPNPIQPSETEFFACHICLKVKPAIRFSNNMMRGTKRKHGPKNKDERKMRYCIPCGVKTAKYQRGREFHHGGGLYDNRKVGVVCWERGKFADQDDKGFRELPQKDHNLCLDRVATSESWETKTSRVYDSLMSQGRVTKTVKLSRPVDATKDNQISVSSINSILGKRKLCRRFISTSNSEEHSLSADEDMDRTSFRGFSPAANAMSTSEQDSDGSSTSSSDNESTVSASATQSSETSGTSLYTQRLRAAGFTDAQAKGIFEVLADMLDNSAHSAKRVAATSSQAAQSTTPMSPEGIRSIVEAIPPTRPTEKRMEAARGYKMPPVMKKRMKDAGKSYKTNKSEKQPSHVHFD